MEDSQHAGQAGLSVKEMTAGNKVEKEELVLVIVDIVAVVLVTLVAIVYEL